MQQVHESGAQAQGISGHQALLTKAGAQLLDAAAMLRIEAQEWRARKNEAPKNWTMHADNGDWKSKCERLAEINVSAATSFEATARKIAAATIKAEA